RDVFGRRRLHAQLGAVGHLHEIVTTRAEENLPHHGSRYDVFRHRGLLRPQTHDVLADGSRALAAADKLAAVAARVGAGAGEMGIIERAALDDVARADETGDEFRAWPLVDV